MNRKKQRKDFINDHKWLNEIVDSNGLTKNVCIGDVYHMHFDVNSFQKTKKKTELSPEKYEENENVKCNKSYRLNVVSLMIYIIVDGRLDMAHANMIIVDNHKKTFERFEPQVQKTVLYDKHINKVLNTDFIEKYQIQDYTFISNTVICPNIGPQDYLEGTLISGTCAYWSYWYAEQRILYPDKNPTVILSRELDKGPSHIRNLIINYIERLKEKGVLLKNYKLFYENKLDDYKTFLKKHSSFISNVRNGFDCIQIPTNKLIEIANEFKLDTNQSKFSLCRELLAKFKYYVKSEKEYIKYINSKKQDNVKTSPVSRKPVSRKPRKPVSRKPVSRKPVSRKPVSRKPVSRKPVSRKPVSNTLKSLKQIAKEKGIKSLHKYNSKNKDELIRLIKSYI